LGEQEYLLKSVVFYQFQDERIFTLIHRLFPFILSLSKEGFF